MDPRQRASTWGEPIVVQAAHANPPNIFINKSLNLAHSYQLSGDVRPKKKISQTLLAKELGVSQALVSLALNGRSAGINPDTYQRIWDRAISQGYLPKGMRVESTPDASLAGQIGYILRAPLRLY